jgi:hypothetical protein
MSLETQLKLLTEAVTLLNESITRLQPNGFFVAEQENPFSEEYKAADKIVEDAKIESLENEAQSTMSFDIPEMTHEELKQVCLEKVRKDATNKAKIKSILAEYGATKAGDISSEKLVEVIGKVEAL